MDKPHDLRLDLPARAYINAQLLALIEQGATLLEAEKHLFSPGGTVPLECKQVGAGPAIQRRSVMRHEPTEADRDVLQYRTPAPRAASTSAGALGGFSLLCIMVPIVGFAIHSGLLFLIGLPLSLIGAGLGIGSMVANAKASRVSALGILGTVGNGLSAAYFIWLFVVRGLC